LTNFRIFLEESLGPYLELACGEM